MSAHFSPTSSSSVGAGAAVISAPGRGAVYGAKRRQTGGLDAAGGVRHRSPDARRQPVAMV